MTAYNIVRMRVKPGMEHEFINLHHNRTVFDGAYGFDLVNTGEREYVLVGKWESMDALAAARPQMIGILDDMRHVLEELEGDTGLTDPRSGDVVFSLEA